MLLCEGLPFFTCAISDTFYIKARRKLEPLSSIGRNHSSLTISSNLLQGFPEITSFPCTISRSRTVPRISFYITSLFSSFTQNICCLLLRSCQSFYHTPSSFFMYKRRKRDIYYSVKNQKIE